MREPRKEEKNIVSFKVWDKEEEETELYALKQYIVQGSREGPHVVVNAGSHGDEFLAIDTAKRVYEELEPENVRGTVSIIPEANVFACLKNKRETPEPEFEVNESEERNLNRCFDSVDLEEGPTGNITERLAYYILNLVSDADYCLDLHTATAPGYKLEQIRGKTSPKFSKEVHDAQEQLIRNSGIRYVIKTPSDSIGKGVLAGTAPLYGVPAVTVEIGGGAYSEDELERYTEVVMNLLKAADTLQGEPEDVEQEIYRDMHEVFATTAGEYEPKKESGDDIRKGEALGIIRNETGEHEVVSAYDGLVESVHRQDWVNEGTRVSYIAIKKERGFFEALVDTVSRILERYATRVGKSTREGLVR